MIHHEAIWDSPVCGLISKAVGKTDALTAEKEPPISIRLSCADPFPASIGLDYGLSQKALKWRLWRR